MEDGRIGQDEYNPKSKANTLRRGHMETLYVIGIAALFVAILVPSLAAARGRVRAEKLYNSDLPQKEIIKKYDRNLYDGRLERSELQNLLRDYELVRREK